jgi:hypothetical protein
LEPEPSTATAAERQAALAGPSGHLSLTTHERSTESRKACQFLVDDRSCGALDIAQDGAGCQIGQQEHLPRLSDGLSDLAVSHSVSG